MSNKGNDKMNGYPKSLSAAGLPYLLTLRGGAELSENEVAEVAQLVHAGGAVRDTIEQIERRVKKAHVFVIALQARKIAGVAALKAPNPSYRDMLRQETGVDLSVDMYPAELGYVAVAESCRGGRLSSILMAELMSLPAGREGVFVTTKREGFYKFSLPDLGFNYEGFYLNGDGEAVHLLTKSAACQTNG